jgi:hypothetical protein
MTPQRCLDWCREANGADLDERTARNALEWLLAHAAKAADTNADRDAIEGARQAAIKALVAP